MKIVAISDTHNLHEQLTIPECDLLIHAGDATMVGSPGEMKAFFRWFIDQPAKEKVFVPGNHEVGFYHYLALTCGQKKLPINLISDYCYPPSSTSNDHVLVDKMCLMPMANKKIIIYGSPWTTVSSRWGFQFSEWQENGITPQVIWSEIPYSTDILVTHGPPKGILDLVPCKGLSKDSPDWLKIMYEKHKGDEILRNEIEKRHNIKYHFFGHIHEGYGHRKVGGVNYYNVSICNEGYKAVNPITIVDTDEWN